MNLYKYTIFTQQELENRFSTSIAHGLTQEEAQKRLKTYGSNALQEKGIAWYHLLFRQTNTALTYLLVSASIISFFLESNIHALLIVLIIFINALVSFFQEYRAEQALLNVKEHLTPTVKVLRNGVSQIIPSTELVPGDIIFLQAGDRIPADVIFIEANSVTVDESILTGESAPAQKIAAPLAKPATTVYEAVDAGFLGTTLTSGNARALVIATGTTTTFGTISKLTIATEHISSFQLKLAQLSKFLLTVALITLVALFSFHLILKGTHTDIIQLLLFSLALTIGLAPEALPVVTTFALSRGALQLAQHGVIVKRLSSIEDLGAITILCADKTGTLTENALTVVSSYPIAHAPLLVYALLASKKEHVTEPFDKAFWTAATEEEKSQESQFKRIQEVPFDPSKRRNLVLVKNSHHILIARGAYEEIIKHCAPTDIKELAAWMAQQSIQGNRLIALASKELTNTPQVLESELHDLTLAGVIAFEDPLKPTAVHAVTQAHKLGITIKMITGDSKEVACAVAQQVGLRLTPDCALTGAEFDNLSLDQKAHAVETYNVFARISPQQKYDIVSLLRHNHTVGFLGEGINDAPALKVAHVGLVVQHASDLAKDAADIILLKKSLNVIVEGIAIGRNIFSNTIKYIVSSLSSTFGNFYSVAVSSLFINFLPMLPIQILLVNLLSDFPMIAIATDTVDPEELKQPHTYQFKGIALIAIILGLVSSVFDFVTFAFFVKKGPAVLRTNWFIESIFTELAFIYSLRTHHPFYKAKRPSGILMTLSLVIAAITLALPSMGWSQHLFQFTSPTLHNLIIVFLIVLAYFITTEAVKLLYYRWTHTT